MNRSRARAPNLRPIDRIIASLCAGLMRPGRLLRSAIVLKPSTLMAFHRALVNHKYRLLFAPRRRKPGPKGPSSELIAAIVDMKRRNPRFGCRRIAQQIAFVFGVEIDKDVVRRVLAKHCQPTGGGDGPSWLAFLGHAKDSLWSVDLFRCESLTLKTHWVMGVMDQFTRRIIGFVVQPGVVAGPALCRMFNQVIAGVPTLPQHLSSDHDPLFEFHRKSFRKVVWKADQQSWARLHEEAFCTLGGASKYVALDNLEQGVIRPDLYEPQLNPIYDALLPMSVASPIPIAKERWRTR